MADPLRQENTFSQYFTDYTQRKTATPVKINEAAPTSQNVPSTQVAPLPEQPQSVGQAFAAYMDDYNARKAGVPAETAPVEGVSGGPSSGWFSRLSQAWQLGSASTQYASTAATRELGAWMEERFGPWQDKARELVGLPPNEHPAEVRAEMMRNDPGIFELEAKNRLTALQGFQQMTSADVNGVMSGLQYAMETVASSAPAMLPILASGGFAGPIALSMQAGQVNEELKGIPNLDDNQRLALSYSAGTLMASLDILGLGVIFGNMGPAQIAKMAAARQLSEFLGKKGLTNSTARVIEASMLEGSTEALQEAIQGAAAELGGKEFEPGEIASRLREGFFGGMAAGGIMRVPAEFAFTPQEQAPVGSTAEEVSAKIDLGTLTEDDLGVSAVAEKPAQTSVNPPINPVLKPTDPAVQAPMSTPGETAVIQQVPGPDLQTPVPTATLEVQDPKVDSAFEGLYAELAKLTVPSVDPSGQVDSAELPATQTVPPVVVEGTPEEKAMSPMMQKTFDIVEQALTVQGVNMADVEHSDRLGALAEGIHKVLISPNYMKGKVTDNQLMNLAVALMDAGAPSEMISNSVFTIINPDYEARNNSQFMDSIIHDVDAYNELRFEMDKVGLTATGLAFLGERTGVNAGFYHEPTDLIAVKARGKVGLERGVTIGHEVIHALKAVGAFNSAVGAKAWKILKDYVEANIPDDAIVGQANYAPETYTEEKIAELYGQYNNMRNSRIAMRRSGIPQPVVDALEVLRKGFEIVNAWIDKYFKNKPLKNYTKMTKPWHALEFIASGEIKNYYNPPGFSEAMETTDRLNRLASRVGNISERKSTKKLTQHADYYNYIVNYGWNVIQLAKKNTHIPWLQSYVEHASRWYNKKMAWLSRANETTAIWSNLGLTQQQNLAKMIFEIEEMNYRSPQEIANGVVRKPTMPELTALMAKHKINKAGLEVYVKMRQDFDAILNELERITIRDAIRTLAASSIAQQLKTAQIQAEFAEIRKRPYFPHARFGNYSIVVTDSQGVKQYVETFHTETSRNAARSSIEKQFPGHTVANSFVPQEAEIFKGLPPSFLEAIKNNLQLTTVQQAALEDLIIATSPTQAFKKKFIHQDMTPGYSRDALRAFADFFWHAANHIARLEFGPELRGSIREGDKNVELMTVQGLDSTKRVQMIDFLRRHLESIMNPKVDWAALRSVGFLWWLGFNVKSAVLNLTQVPLVTAPFLSAHFNEAKTLAELTKTYTKIRSTYSRQKNWNNSYTPDEAAALHMGVEQGFLNESFAQQLAGIAEGSNLLRTRAGNRMHKGWLQFQQAAGYMFQTMEQVNRRVTFLTTRNLALKNPNAAYLGDIRKQYGLQLQDLVQQNGWTVENATAFLAGKDAVRSSQFEYSQWARPRFMQGRASAFFTFFMFTQNMLWFIQNSPGSTRYLLLLLASAGIMGLPGAEDLEALAKFIGRNIFGKEWNLEKELGEMLVELTDAPPDLFIHGLSRHGFGLEQLGDLTGIPLPATDLSGNLGMGSPVPIFSPLAQALGRQGDFNDKLAQFTSEGIGATFGIGVGIARALSDTDANPRRWEQALPAAVANISKAYRQWKTGEETMRGRAQLIPYDRNDPEHMAELIAQSLGFRSTRSSQAWDLRISQIEAAEFWSLRRSLLLGQYDLAHEGGDKGDVEDVIAAIKRYNSQVPFSDLKLTNETIQKSRKTRQAIRARREAGRPDAKYLSSVYRHLESIHPQTYSNQFEEPSP